MLQKEQEAWLVISGIRNPVNKGSNLGHES